VAFALIIIFCGVYSITVLPCGIRPSNNILFISAPGNNIMAFALRRSPGSSISLIIYAPYNVLLIITLLLLPPPVITRLWLSFYDDPPVIAPAPIIYALIAVPCGVPPVIT